MKFSIRDLFLVTMIVALGLGWLVDHWRAAARDEQWESCFFHALDVLSSSDRQERKLDTPAGIVRLNPMPELEK